MTISPQEHQDLKLGFITLHWTRLDPKKLIKLDRIDGLIAHESGQYLGQPQPTYKIPILAIIILYFGNMGV